jgi:peptidoglycan-N-acetylglucosamine deacetylase
MNILTFDLEDWFHLLDNESTKGEKEWLNFESRFESNTEQILAILKEKNQKATFFCLGWICLKYPKMIRKISDLGFHIGCHSDMHQLTYEQDQESFRQDLVSSIRRIEDCTGKKVNAFRAPGFSITTDTQWAFQVLIEEGITMDSSVFPASRAHGGFPEITHSSPFKISFSGKEVLEFPINVYPFLGRKIIFSGGGYFRLFPYPLIKRFSERSPYIMSYFHPRDFDSEQPMIRGLTVTRKFKSYYGLKSSMSKFEKWITDFSFTDLLTATETIEKGKVQSIPYSRLTKV